MAKYGMAIDLRKCVGCGACGIACKTENNTEHRNSLGNNFNWADFLTFTTGTFPNVKFRAIPVLCNHCTTPDCVPACPVAPDSLGHKAIYKTADGITMYDVNRCTGCQLCQGACRYSSQNVIADDVQYSVLSYNPNTGSPTHAFWAGNTAVIPNCTATPLETATAAAFTPPYKNDYTDPDYTAVRPSDVIEKCTFCRHRVALGELPYCVVSCPASARVFGDLDDPSSAISVLLAANVHGNLANNTGDWLSGSLGTRPNVYYLGDDSIPTVTVSQTSTPYKSLKISPNPVSSNAVAEFDLKYSNLSSITIYNSNGKEVRRIEQNEFRLFGSHSLQFNVAGLSRGTYIFTVKTAKEVMSANFVVTQ